LDRQTGVVDGLYAGHFRFGIAPAKWAEIDVVFPFAQVVTEGAAIGPTGIEAANFGIGDLSILGRFALLNADEKPLGIALIPSISLPTGQRALYLSHGVPVLGLDLALSKRFKWVHWAASLGYHLKPGAGQVGASIAADDEINYGAAFGVSPFPDFLDINLELVGIGIVGPGRKALTNTDYRGAIHSPLELHIGARLRTPAGIDMVLGGGPGLTPGAGTPGYRLYAGLAFQPGPKKEEPPPEPVVVEPPPPPPPKDSDGDGIMDPDDKCPFQPEDKDGFEDNDGCVDWDNDSDGIVDSADKCPMEPEDRDGLGDADGCPEEDYDKDTVLDPKDLCPEIPGVPAAQGCPADVKAVVTTERIVILDRVLFDTDKDVIKKVSYPILDAVAKTLASHPEIKKVRVEGHTDSQADDAHNLDLSQRRAAAVVKYLVGKKVDAARLEPQGYGETQPIADNETEDGRAQNRRVVFTILE
jgi:outer membrane protein OmpA-like peptidoglycan-associated protein